MARAGMSDEEMTTFLKETFCVDSARTVWDFPADNTCIRRVANLPTYPPCRPDGRGRTYLPTPRAYLSGGPTYYEKT